MADDVELQAAQDIASINEQIKTAESRLNLLNDAGEDVTALRQTLRELKARRDRWTKALELRGITIPNK